MTTTAEFVERLATSGRYHFTAEQAVEAVGSSRASVLAALRRLKTGGVVAQPHRGFYVVVPYEYRVHGCLPPEQFVPQLMEYLGEPYYAALLTAAAFHGAAHQRPQGFQVMIRAPRRRIRCGRNVVYFVAHRGMDQTPVVRISTPRGPCLVSSREATALEIVGYPDQCVGLDNVATVLAELGPELDTRKLLEVLPVYPIAWVQRLGYLLELVEADLELEPMARYVAERSASPAPLVRSHSRAGIPRDDRWRVLVNADVEPDL